MLINIPKAWNLNDVKRKQDVVFAAMSNCLVVISSSKQSTRSSPWRKKTLALDRYPLIFLKRFEVLKRIVDSNVTKMKKTTTNE